MIKIHILRVFIVILTVCFISCSGNGGRVVLYWYVKPYDPQSVNGNGMSYCEAWNGVENIDWSQIEPGDTIYLCGTFTDTIEIKKSGYISYSIKINGNCPKSDCGNGESGTDKGVVMPVLYVIDKWGEGLKGDPYLKPPTDSDILAYRGDELKKGIPLAIAKDESLISNGYSGYIKLPSLSIPQYQCNNICPDDNDPNYINHLNNIFSSLGENQYYYESCCNVLYWKPSASVLQRIYVVDGIGLKFKDVSNIYVNGVVFIGGSSAIRFEGNKIGHIDIKGNSFRWITGKAVEMKAKSIAFVNIEGNSFLDTGIPLYAKDCVSLENINIKKNKIHRSALQSIFFNANLESIIVEGNTFSEKGIYVKSCNSARAININFNHFYNMGDSTAVDIDTSSASHPEVLSIQFNLIRNADKGITLRTYDNKHPYIYNNTFYKNKTVLRWISSTVPRKPALYFVNNILYEIQDYYIYIENTDDYQNAPMFINNNIYFSENSNYDPAFAIGNDADLAFNQWRDEIRYYTQNNSNEENSKEGEDPSLVNETGNFSEVKDFKLSCNSTLIDAGAEPEGLLSKDFFGSKVPLRKPDVGFHEFQGQPCPS